MLNSTRSPFFPIISHHFSKAEIPLKNSWCLSHEQAPCFLVRSHNFLPRKIHLFCWENHLKAPSKSGGETGEGWGRRSWGWTAQGSAHGRGRLASNASGEVMGNCVRWGFHGRTWDFTKKCWYNKPVIRIFFWEIHGILGWNSPPLCQQLRGELNHPWLDDVPFANIKHPWLQGFSSSAFWPEGKHQNWWFNTWFTRDLLGILADLLGVLMGFNGMFPKISWGWKHRTAWRSWPPVDHGPEKIGAECDV